jgi:hypothetical protein
VSGCVECSIDHHLACPLLGEEDDGFNVDEDGWYSVHLRCGLAVDSHRTLRRRGWSQSAGPGQHLGERS